ncbi:hypothetical protein LCGC14_2549350 [marine sediment metagenome]|uniref:DNA N-6-adenine-methyltransferase (Dam) n=1 Tax=marine sediment metagenome TaxID=412755 RepID=A0A0F9CZM5_9ZZZZ
MSVHFSSLSGEWSTPQGVFDQLNAEFGFTLDVCATHDNAKCPEYYTKEDDGLSKNWNGICWLNSPYGREIPKWIAKAYHEARAGRATVVCLIPSRTDTRWWHDYVMKADEIRFIKGRPKFKGCTHGLPQPLAIVVFGSETEQTLLKNIGKEGIVGFEFSKKNYGTELHLNNFWGCRVVIRKKTIEVINKWQGKRWRVIEGDTIEEIDSKIDAYIEELNTKSDEAIKKVIKYGHGKPDMALIKTRGEIGIHGMNF